MLERDFKYSKDEISNIALKISCFVEVIEPKQKVEVVKEDPDDDKVIECAIESGSEYILTYDKHLLKLKEFRGIKIITPDEFDKILHD